MYSPLSIRTTVLDKIKKVQRELEFHAGRRISLSDVLELVLGSVRIEELRNKVK
jgi:hypothetical protein